MHGIWKYCHFNNLEIKGKFSNFQNKSSIKMLFGHNCNIGGEIPSTFMDNNTMIFCNSIAKSWKEVAIKQFLKLLLMQTFQSNYQVDYICQAISSESEKWYDIMKQQSLLLYVLTNERNARNLLITKESKFFQILLVGVAVAIASVLLVFTWKELFRTYVCKDKYLFCCDCVVPWSKLPEHAGFLQLQVKKRRKKIKFIEFFFKKKLLLKSLNNWFEMAVICILAAIYWEYSIVTFVTGIF
ncbi:hypothetical protein RFI_16456 [Reticulomyxa filosa]|uniref:Uncharacterized protein n=1 Tax=Reticulomyxa filosa TaxID=46433 RepID=X6N3A5_RETFI|nr:hypothetical protein RFI_16456 [Reticulomyxa filosa]|eukprot:ETO20760.1 hypothetical protein RFI_16456 [Reticulomyxa filosa]